MASTALRISIAGKCWSSNKEPFFACNSGRTLPNSFRPLRPPPRPAGLCFSSRRRERDIPSVSSKIIKTKVSKEENVGEDGSAADSLFRKLREVLKNVDDDISGEELEKLEQELGEALTDEELFGALECLADGETKNEEKEEEGDEEEDDDDDGEVDIDGEDGGGLDDISEVEEEIAKLVQELADVLEDDKFVEVMDYVARGETEDEEDDEVEEEEDGDSDYEVEVVEVEMDGDENEEEKDDDTDYEVKVVEVEMNDDKDEHDETDEEGEQQEDDDDDDYEAKVVDVEIDEEEEDGDDEDDINKLTELVEKLSTALEDDDILIKFQ